MQRKISFAQNAEDVRVWRAFHNLGEFGPGLTFVDVGANEPRHLSITASLHDLGWRGLLIEADPTLAEVLRVQRPGDTVIECAASDTQGIITFHRVPGTGLGTLDAKEAHAARERGFAVETVEVKTERLDAILDRHASGDVHFMSIDVEGAEANVLAGLDLSRHRPWILCVEAVLPGTTTPSHESWEPRILSAQYTLAAFDGVNRWYVADERIKDHSSLLEDVATPFNAIDVGEHAWTLEQTAQLIEQVNRAALRTAWQREVILNDVRNEVPRSEYERQISELRNALISVEGSRSLKIARRATKVARGVVFRVRRAVDHLPLPMKEQVIRRRHLRHVTVNMGHLTPEALLKVTAAPDATWISPERLPTGPAGGLDPLAFTAADAQEIREWLHDGPWDDDEMLDRRMDNHGDELGRAIRALTLRLKLAEITASPKVAQRQGSRVLFDARCLQTPAFGNRGIGRFAAAALRAAQAATDADQLVLLVDDGLEELPTDLVGYCVTTTRVTEVSASSYGLFIQPSPMTASVQPYLPVLAGNAHKLAVVFDFIPLHHMAVYLRDVAARAEYSVAMDALRLYDEYVCISHLVQGEVQDLLGVDPKATSVAWPSDVLPLGVVTQPANGAGPIVLMTGDDARKNTFGGLAAIGAATAGDTTRDVIVIGMAGQGTRVHHWSIAAAMRPGEARVPERMTVQELESTLSNASLVVVPSFDEGLSLPVIEAVLAGAPVVASDIPSHRELIGSGGHLADPTSPADMTRAIRRNLRRTATQKRQMTRLARHRHANLEDVIRDRVLSRNTSMTVEVPPAAVHVEGRTLRVALAGPWVPQRSGVADFTTTTTLELARLADVTVFTTSGAEVDTSAGVLRHRNVRELVANHHDVLAAVVGNSHFHLPYLDVINDFEPVVVTHDTRLVEFYLALRSAGGVTDLMLRGTALRNLHPPLDEQIDDMRLLQNTAFWEVARRARMLIAHTPTAAPRLEAETGRPVRLLPFANQRVPHVDQLTADLRAQARKRLGFDTSRFDGSVNLASFGFLDARTKMTDVVLEAAAWLTQWGHRVSLHLVGQASDPLQASLMKRAAEAGIANVEITGYVSDETFRDYLMAIDLGVQLRISPLLGVSGPLSDMSAFGTPAIASRGLAIDVDAPAFIDRLPDDVSPVLVAEAIEARLASPMPEAEVEELRRDYLARKSPASYAEQLLTLLNEAAAMPGRGDA